MPSEQQYTYTSTHREPEKASLGLHLCCYNDYGGNGSLILDFLARVLYNDDSACVSDTVLRATPTKRFKISKHISHHTMERFFQFPGAKFRGSRV